jgi:hypothetical protein
MKEIIKNIFSKKNEDSIQVTISKRITPGKYETIDDSGRSYIVFSSISWYPGSRVIIQNDRIIASSGTIETIKTYEV